MHELDFSTGSAAIAYAGETPWHKHGTRFDDLMTSAQAFQAAKLDWTVEKHPAYYVSATGEKIRVPNWNATVRSDTGAPLGCVGEAYEPIQNITAFDFMDTVITEGQIRYEVAGALFGGKKVWLLAKMPSSTKISHDDITNHYLLFTNTHDGSGMATVGYTTVRVVCNNTLRIANPKYRYRIRHTGNVMDKLSEARNVLGLADAAFSEFNQQALALSFKQKTKHMVEQFKLALFGKSDVKQMTKTDNESWAAIERLMEEGQGTDLPGVKDSAWGMVNAVTEWVDHERKHRSKKDAADFALDTNTYGTGSDIKSRAWQLALATI